MVAIWILMLFAGSGRLRASCSFFGTAVVLAVLSGACTEPRNEGPFAPNSAGESAVPLPNLAEQISGTEERLQAVSAVNDRVAWVSGVGAVWARTLDGGESWEVGTAGDDPELQFRDVHAVSGEVAYLLSSGPGSASRVFKTVDGGESWQQQLTATQEASFWDCFDFWDAERGLLFGDSVNGQIEVWRTQNGGVSWDQLDPPAALEGEGGFAASGTCLETRGPGRAVFVTGNSVTSRRFATEDWGDSWKVSDLPLPAGEGQGAMSTVLLPATGKTAAVELVFGGDLGDPETGHDAVARSRDGGKTWNLAPRPDYPGPIYGAAVAETSQRAALLAVGPMGAAVSFDRGDRWQGLSLESHWSVDFVGPVGWMVGPQGRITKIVFGDR